MKTKLFILLCATSVFSDSLCCFSAENQSTTETQRTQRLHREDAAIVVLDPQTSRVRAVVNPEIAFGNSVPPGSTIKPFITLAALRAGIISKDSRLRCRQKYKREDVVDSCSHAPNPAP